MRAPSTGPCTPIPYPGYQSSGRIGRAISITPQVPTQQGHLPKKARSFCNGFLFALVHNLPSMRHRSSGRTCAQAHTREGNSRARDCPQKRNMKYCSSRRNKFFRKTGPSVFCRFLSRIASAARSRIANPPVPGRVPRAARVILGRRRSRPPTEEEPKLWRAGRPTPKIPTGAQREIDLSRDSQIVESRTPGVRHLRKVEGPRLGP